MCGGGNIFFEVTRRRQIDSREEEKKCERAKKWTRTKVAAALLLRFITENVPQSLHKVVEFVNQYLP